MNETNTKKRPINLPTSYAVYAILSLLIFVRQFNTFPMLDDFVYFLWFDNTDLKSLPYLLSPFNGYFWIRPLAILVCNIEYFLFGTFMPGYRLAGILWHSASALMILRLAEKSLKMPSGTAFGAGLLFLFHPAAVQAVCYPSARSETMYLFFVLATMVLFAEYSRPDGKPCSIVAGMICFWLALMAKETAFVVIPLTFVWLMLSSRWKTHAGKSIVLAGSLLVSGFVYGLLRYSVYHGFGGYNLGLERNLPFSDQLLTALSKIFVIFPVMHLLPISPDCIGSNSLYLCFGMLYAAALLLLGFRSSSFRPGYLFACCLLFFSGLILTAVFLHYDALLLPPRYLYLGSAAVALMMAPVFYPVRRSHLWIMIPAACLWIFGQIGFQKDFHRAGEVTRYILTTIDHYCFYLSDGGHIEIYNIPDRIGSICINIPDEKYTVYNLESHRRCGLAPAFDITQGQGMDNWSRFMDSLPGRVSVFSTSPPAIRADNTLVIPLDIREAGMAETEAN